MCTLKRETAVQIGQSSRRKKINSTTHNHTTSAKPGQIGMSGDTHQKQILIHNRNKNPNDKVDIIKTPLLRLYLIV